MQVFQVSTGPTPGPRNYVFVDEHNRHKRLKVMRACEGCRRRKIKCDAATTNTWPCGACRRLKLPCVPPVGGGEGDQQNDPPDVSLTDDSPKVGSHQFQPQYDQFSSQYPSSGAERPNLANSGQYNIPPAQHMYHMQEYPYSQTNQHNQQNHLQLPLMHNGYRYQSVDASASQNSASSPNASDQQTAELLMEQLGELKISENGVAPYTRQQEASNREPAAPIQETETTIPRLNTTVGSQIRIPPALMPSAEDAAELFAIFFQHVHPYVPVVCRDYLNHQWKNNRSSISPLLLEAIFACAARISGEPVGESSWLALANRRHDTSNF
jgi:hypothetical protein